jgi:hypothetical protein
MGARVIHSSSRLDNSPWELNQHTTVVTWMSTARRVHTKPAVLSESPSTLQVQPGPDAVGCVTCLSILFSSLKNWEIASGWSVCVANVDIPMGIRPFHLTWLSMSGGSCIRIYNNKPG